jgi:putative addiction module component (TIGR02574 family)
MQADLLQAAKALSIPERLELAEALWDSITEEDYQPELTPLQERELDCRLKAHQKNPEAVIAWEQVRAELINKYGVGQ